MKIVLVAVNARYTHTNLAVRYLKKCVMDERVELREYHINMKREEIYADLRRLDADVYAFSTYIWNIGYCRYLAEALLDKLILFGGPEASNDIASSLSYADYVIKGEGERAFLAFCAAFFSERTLLDLPSLCYKKGDRLVENPPSEPLEMDELPFPYGEEDEFSNKLVYYESSRGCPFSCAYCLSSAEGNLRFSSIDRVKWDLDFFAAHPALRVKFVDRTFNANPARAAAILAYANDHAKHLELHVEAAAELIDEAFISELKRSLPGKIQLEIGIQSTNPATLAAVGRRQELAHTKRVVKEIVKGRNVRVHLDLIAGLPLEGQERFKQSFDQVMAMGADVVQLGFLKLLKGSKLEKAAGKYGIFCGAEAPYEVKRTDVISEGELQALKKVEYLLERVYNSGLYQMSTRIISDALGSYYGYFEKLAERLEKLALPGGKPNEGELLLLLVGFIREELGGDTLFMDALRYDWLNKQVRPRPAAGLEKQADWERKFYANLPEDMLPGLPKGKRAWRYSRAAEFCFDPLEFEETGRVRLNPVRIFFDYINDAKKRI